MEVENYKNYRTNYKSLLIIEKFLVEKSFSWLKLEIVGEYLLGKGKLVVADKVYRITISYSHINYFEHGTFDLIQINGIEYNRKIHVYSDVSLCLYHPKTDVVATQIIPLSKMIPWISEWIVNYEKFKKYGVWLGKEIEH